MIYKTCSVDGPPVGFCVAIDRFKDDSMDLLRRSSMTEKFGCKMTLKPT